MALPIPRSHSSIVLCEDFHTEWRALLRDLQLEQTISWAVQLRASWMVLRALWKEARIWANPYTQQLFESEEDIPADQREAVSLQPRWLSQGDFLETLAEYGLCSSTFRRRHGAIELRVAIRRARTGQEPSIEEFAEIVRDTVLSPTATNVAGSALFQTMREPVTRELLVIGLNEDVAERFVGELPEDEEEALKEVAQAVEDRLDSEYDNLRHGRKHLTKVSRGLREDLYDIPQITAFADTEHKCYGIHVLPPSTQDGKWTVQPEERYTVRVFDAAGRDITWNLPPFLGEWLRHKLGIAV